MSRGTLLELVIFIIFFYLVGPDLLLFCEHFLKGNLPKGFGFIDAVEIAVAGWILIRTIQIFRTR